MFIVAHGARSVIRLLRFLTREKQHYIRHIQSIELCGALGPSIPLQVAHVRDVFTRERSHRDKTNRLQTRQNQKFHVWRVSSETSFAFDFAIRN